MTKKEKLLQQMRNNPKGWTIGYLKLIATQFDILIKRGKGSHVNFTHPKWKEILTIPDHKPIKTIYVKKFLSLIDDLEVEI